MVSRIVLVDDHTLLRSALSFLLNEMPGFKVVGEAGEGRTALDLIQTLRPNIVLMDITMPGLNGLETLGAITRDFPKIKVIILSGHANEEYVLRAMLSGARGYMVKDSAKKELQVAMDAVRKGENYMSPSISKTAIGRDQELAQNSKSQLLQLTPRQRQVLQLLAEGKNTKEIGSMLRISPKTVETHRMQFMVRLKIHDVPGLVRFAIRSGLVSSQA